MNYICAEVALHTFLLWLPWQFFFHNNLLTVLLWLLSNAGYRKLLAWSLFLSRILLLDSILKELHPFLWYNYHWQSYDCQMWNLEIRWLSVCRLFLLYLTFISVEYLKAFQSFYSMFVLIIENSLWMLNIWSHRRLLLISIAFISVGCLRDIQPFYTTFVWIFGDLLWMLKILSHRSLSAWSPFLLHLAFYCCIPP